METKPIIDSTTVRNVVMLLSLVLGLLGVDISKDEQISIADAVTVVIIGGIAIYSSVKAIIGRIKAKRDLTIGGKLL